VKNLSKYSLNVILEMVCQTEQTQRYSKGPEIN